MGAIGDIVVGKGFPTVICFQACPLGGLYVCSSHTAVVVLYRTGIF